VEVTWLPLGACVIVKLKEDLYLTVKKKKNLKESNPILD
jgi:hypothetical protein